MSRYLIPFYYVFLTRVCWLFLVCCSWQVTYEAGSYEPLLEQGL
jgi:hypothetical protein